MLDADSYPVYAEGNTLRAANRKALAFFDKPEDATRAAKALNACERMADENLAPEGFHRLALALREARASVQGLAGNADTAHGEGCDLSRAAIGEACRAIVEAIDREHDIATGRACHIA